MAKIWGKTDWKAQRVKKKECIFFQSTNIKVAELHNYYSNMTAQPWGKKRLYTSLCIGLYEDRQYLHI